MKSAVVVLVISLFLAKPSFSQERDKEAMIKKIFAVFAEKDEEGYMSLFPDAAMLKEFIVSKLNKDSALNNNPEMQATLDAIQDSSLQSELKIRFQKYLQMGESNGVNWTLAKFVSYTADSILIEDEMMKAPMLKGKIYFEVGGTAFFIAYNEVILFDNKGWYGVSVERIDFKSKENENIGYDWDAKGVDTNLMVMDSVVAVTTVADTSMTVIAQDIKPVKNKTNKDPGKSKSAKTKLQTPIRKED